MKSLVLRFLNDERGTSVIEYGMVASLVSVAIIATAEGIGHAIQQLFGEVTDTLNAANGYLARR